MKMGPWFKVTSEGQEEPGIKTHNTWPVTYPLCLKVNQGPQGIDMKIYPTKNKILVYLFYVQKNKPNT